MRSGWRYLWGLCLALTFLLAALAPGHAQGAGEGGAGGDDEIVLNILDEDALLVVQRVDGRDVVRVLGRSQVSHRRRVAWSDELQYDEGQRRVVLRGAVELMDQGDDPLDLAADLLELDLDTEAALARGNVRFTQEDARGSAEELHYGEYAQLLPVIEAQLAARRSSSAALQSLLVDFLPGDRILVLIGNVQVEDADRAFSAEFVVLNTRTDALLSVGRSAARLPGPAD